MLKENRYLTVEEVAERLRVTEKTVRQWINDGRLVAIKPVKQFLIAESDLETFERAARDGNNGHNSR